MNLTKRELKKIRAGLPKGSYLKIAEELNVGEATVKAALFNPSRFNEAIVARAVAIIRHERAKVEELKEAIKQL